MRQCVSSIERASQASHARTNGKADDTFDDFHSFPSPDRFRFVPAQHMLHSCNEMQADDDPRANGPNERLAQQKDNAFDISPSTHITKMRRSDPLSAGHMHCWKPLLRPGPTTCVQQRKSKTIASSRAYCEQSGSNFLFEGQLLLCLEQWRNRAVTALRPRRTTRDMRCGSETLCHHSLFAHPAFDWNKSAMMRPKWSWPFFSDDNSSDIGRRKEGFTAGVD